MQLCPRCESLNSDGVERCSCGHQFATRTVSRIHPPPPPVDQGRVGQLQAASRSDLRNGFVLIAALGLLTIVLFTVFHMRPGLLVFGLLFYAVIAIIRGLRLRREAWQLEHLGFIQRERDQAQR
jgi:hypothetical protein